MKRWLLVILVVVAACKGKDKHEDKANKTGTDQAKPALDATAKASAAPDAGTAAAPVAPDAAPAAVMPATPPTACAVGEPVKIATAARTPGDLDLAVAGDVTAVAWFDGGKSFVAVATHTGQLVAEPANLGDNKETFLLATPPGFAVVTITHDHCEMSVRTLDRMGGLGPAVALASKVCNPQQYPLAAVRDGQILVVTSSEYEAEGLQAIRWREGGQPETTTLVPREIYAAPAAVVATETGYAVAWNENEEDPMDLSTTKMVTIDDAGVASKATKFDADEETVALLGAKPVALRVHGGSLELVSGKTKQKLAPAKADDQHALVVLAGRTWALTDSFGTGPTKVVPLDPDGAPAGAGFDAPGNALAHDGARGAVASWTKKELQLHALTCTSP